MLNSVAVRRVGRGVVWGVASLPAIWMVYLVVRYAVDLPLQDAWDLPGTFLRRENGTSVLFHQHNESRPAIPRLISYGLARLTHWDTRWEMVLTLLQAVVNWCLMLRLYLLGESKLTAAGAEPWPTVRPALFFLAGLFVFNMYQTEYLWGLQYLCHIPTTCLLMALVFYESAAPLWAKQVAGLMACVVSMYSFSIGMILWPLLGGYYLLREGFRGKQGRGWAAVWTAVAGLCFWLYFRDYVRPSASPPLSTVFRNPWGFAKGFLSFLGAPLGYLQDNDLSLWLCVCAGVLILLTALGGFAAAVWRCRERPFFQANLPWMVIAAYFIGTALVAAAGRFALGPYVLISLTRYGEFSNYMPAVLVFWEAGVHRYLQGKGGGWSWSLPRVRYAQIGILAVLLPLSGTYGYMRMIEWHRIRVQYRAAMMFAEDVQSPELLLIYPNLHRVARYAKSAHGMAMLRPVPTAIMFDEAAQRPAAGEINEWGMENGKLRIYGWAVLPGKGRPADCVVLTRTVEGKETAFAVAFPEFAAPLGAVHAKLRNKSGWAVIGEELPVGEVKAWAVDGESGAIYPLTRAFKAGEGPG